MSTLNISLTDELKNFITQSTGKNTDFSTPSEYIRSLIRYDKKSKEVQKLRMGVVEGYQDLKSGKVTEYNGDLDKLMTS